MEIDNSKLFFKFYRINYIKNIIFNYIKLYKIYSSQRIFSTYEEFRDFKNKEYLQDVLIYFSKSFDFNLVPELKTIGFGLAKKELLDDLPDSITSVVAPTIYNIDRFKTATKLQNLSLRLSTLGYKSPWFNELESLTELHCPSFRYPLKEEFFPKSLKKLSLSFDLHYRNTITSDSIPKQLEYLRFDLLLEQHFKIESRILPDGLKTFKSVNASISIPNDFYWPSSITNLTAIFKEFPSNLPLSLKKLRLKVQKLPPSLDLCNDFIVPPSLELFKLQILYSQHNVITRNMIPSGGNLVSLKLINIANILDPNYNQKEDGHTPPPSILPNNLKYLLLDNSHGNNGFNNQLLPNQLPSTIVKLKLLGSFNNGGLPLTLDTNKYGNDEFIFNSDLEDIEFGNQFNVEILGSNIFNSKSNKLKSITFGVTFNQIIHPESIPSSVTSISILNSNYSHSSSLESLVDKIPNIKFYGFNVSQIYENIPEKLVSLSLPNSFDSPISQLNLENKINLEHLSFGYLFNHQLVEGLPINNRIKVLEVDGKFDQTINLEYFKCLETLYVKFANPKIITSSSDSVLVENSLNALQSKSQIKYYNFYSLKKIIVTIRNNEFLDSLDQIFYQFLKFSK